MIKIGVAGGAGRMGKAIVAEIARNSRCELVGVTVLEQDQNRGRDAGEVAGIGRLNVPLRHTPVEMFENADVVIDFTSPAASLEHCMLAHGLLGAMHPPAFAAFAAVASHNKLVKQGHCRKLHNSQTRLRQSPTSSGVARCVGQL